MTSRLFIFVRVTSNHALIYSQLNDMPATSLNILGRFRWNSHGARLKLVGYGGMKQTLCCPTDLATALIRISTASALRDWP